MFTVATLIQKKKKKNTVSFTEFNHWYAPTKQQTHWNPYEKIEIIWFCYSPFYIEVVAERIKWEVKKEWKSERAYGVRHDTIHDHLRGLRGSKGERVAGNSGGFFNFSSYVFEYHRGIRIVGTKVKVVVAVVVGFVGTRWKLLRRREGLGDFHRGGAPGPREELHGVARRRAVKRVGSPCGSLLFHYRVRALKKRRWRGFVLFRESERF